jgi:hypothetical protein
MSRWLFFPSLTSLYGEFTYCQLANSQIQAWRPPILVGGTFLYCAQDINQFNRTP